MLKVEFEARTSTWC